MQAAAEEGDQYFKREVSEDMHEKKRWMDVETERDGSRGCKEREKGNGTMQKSDRDGVGLDEKEAGMKE